MYKTFNIFVPPKNCLSIPFILLLSFSFMGISTKEQLTGAINAVQASELTIVAQSAEKLTYDQYMNAGYEAIEAQDFAKALNNFQEALKLRPGDEDATQAISRLKIYAYDYYMEQGYNANTQSDYEIALDYFQKAAKERPDDFYAQQAIRNVQKIIQRRENSIANNFDFFGRNPSNNLLVILIILMIIIAIALILVVLRLFKLKSPENKLAILPKSNFDYQDKKDNYQPNLKTKLLEDKQKNEQLNIDQDHQQSDSSDNFKIISLKETSPINKQDPIEELLSILEEQDPKKRRKAIWKLAQKGDSRAVKPLVKLMINANSYERTLILEALSQINSQILKPMNQALLISLQDDNPQVRKNALRDITKMYDLMSQIYPLINHTAQNDPDEEVREIANWSLQKFSFRNNSPQLNNEQEEINATLISEDEQDN